MELFLIGTSIEIYFVRKNFTFHYNYVCIFSYIPHFLFRALNHESSSSVDANQAIFRRSYKSAFRREGTHRMRKTARKFFLHNSMRRMQEGTVSRSASGRVLILLALNYSRKRCISVSEHSPR